MYFCIIFLILFDLKSWKMSDRYARVSSTKWTKQILRWFSVFHYVKYKYNKKFIKLHMCQNVSKLRKVWQSYGKNKTVKFLALVLYCCEISRKHAELYVRVRVHLLNDDSTAEVATVSCVSSSLMTSQRTCTTWRWRHKVNAITRPTRRVRWGRQCRGLVVALVWQPTR